MNSETPPPQIKCIYRVDSTRFATCMCDEACSHGYDIRVSIHSYSVFSQTPKGVWLGHFHKDRFVRLSGTKRFAYPTKQEAIASFLARKQRQLSILTAQLKEVTRILNIPPSDYQDATDFEL